MPLVKCMQNWTHMKRWEWFISNSIYAYGSRFGTQPLDFFNHKVIHSFALWHFITCMFFEHHSIEHIQIFYPSAKSWWCPGRPGFYKVSSIYKSFNTDETVFGIKVTCCSDSVVTRFIYCNDAIIINDTEIEFFSVPVNRSVRTSELWRHWVPSHLWFVWLDQIRSNLGEILVSNKMKLAKMYKISSYNFLNCWSKSLEM